MAAALREKKRTSPEDMERSILALCRGRYLTLPQLAALTGRRADSLRIKYVTRLAERGALKLRHPEQPTHPAQAYTTADG